MGRDTETQTSRQCKKAKQKFLTVEEASISGKKSMECGLPLVMVVI